MPFDFINFKHYAIDYKRLFNELNSQEILDNSTVQTQYLHKWRMVLEKQDTALSEQLKTQNDVMTLQMNLLKYNELEIFQLPINYTNNKVLLHFRASVANMIMDYHKPQSQNISIEEFTRENGQINWNPVETYADSYINSEKPIFIVPFLSNKYNLLVIDGNHRLTYKIRNKAKEISAVILSELSTIEFEIFSSGFDKMFYIMNNELNYMANATHYQKANAMQLTPKSYLTDGTYKFQE